MFHGREKINDALLSGYFGSEVRQCKSVQLPNDNKSFAGVPICVGSGNEGTAYGHAAGRISKRNEAQSVPFFIGNYETGLSVQLWKNYEDRYRIRLISPGGQIVTLPERLENTPTFRYQLEDTFVYAYGGGPRPYSTKQEIYLQLEPAGRYINEGVWQIELVPESIVTGEYDLYLPSYSAKSEYTRFLTPSVNRTYTIPSTAQRVITVGAYDTVYDAYADFSGRGYVSMQREDGEAYVLGAKPDIVAPGVGIVTTNGREKVVLNGTSFAAPFVTGSAALPMEWGIVMGNDPYLYGEKVKAYFIRGRESCRDLRNTRIRRWGMGRFVSKIVYRGRAVRIFGVISTLFII